MELAISNIAWQPGEDEAVARAMADHAVAAVEIAPTKLWSRPLAATDDDVARARRFWESRGIRVVALQALLFGRPDLVIFGSGEARKATADYLAGMMTLGRKLGARVLVLGAPANRRAAPRPPEEVDAIALEFFHDAGERARADDVILCIEPNPTAYACDFVTTALEGASLVRRVGHPGFGLHLDAAAMTLAGDDVPGALGQCIDLVRHFHVSEPRLAPIGSGGVRHEAFARGLREAGYAAFVSIEMAASSEAANTATVTDALARARATYFAP